LPNCTLRQIRQVAGAGSPLVIEVKNAPAISSGTDLMKVGGYCANHFCATRTLHRVSIVIIVAVPSIVAITLFTTHVGGNASAAWELTCECRRLRRRRVERHRRTVGRPGRRSCPSIAVAATVISRFP